MKSKHADPVTYLYMIIAPFAVWLMVSCSKQTDNLVPQTYLPVVVNTFHPDSVTRTYLALGDSYTIGEAVPEEDRFPVQATRRLRDHGVHMVNPEVIAVTGWTTADLLHALDNTSLSHNYSLVTLLIGVNNQYQGRPLEEYKVQFAELLARAVAYAGGNASHVLVLSIPDYGVTPFAQNRDPQKISKEIDDFNETAKAIAGSAGARYIDITPLSRQAKNTPSLIASDGLHPSGEQYQAWVQLLVPQMLDAIR
jgi:lysophospholipase L1-like esterase